MIESIVLQDPMVKIQLDHGGKRLYFPMLNATCWKKTVTIFFKQTTSPPLLIVKRRNRNPNNGTHASYTRPVYFFPFNIYTTAQLESDPTQIPAHYKPYLSKPYRFLPDRTQPPSLLFLLS
jgi:hypothetical protein